MSRHVDSGDRVGLNLGLPVSGFAKDNRHGVKDPAYPAAIYAEKWTQAAASGGNLFVGRSGESATPLLEAMIGQLPHRGPTSRRRFKIIEAAAGGGEQALYIASKVPNATVVAVDTSVDAGMQTEARRDANRGEIQKGSEIVVVTGDTLGYMKDQKPGSVTGYHGNSFWHFLGEQGRADEIAGIQRVGQRGALVAVSFKAVGDGLLFDPGTDVVHIDDKGVYAVPKDGIERIFVKPEGTIVDEFTAGGLEVVDVIPYSIPDYDIEGKDGVFLGVLARKSAA